MLTWIVACRCAVTEPLSINSTMTCAGYNPVCVVLSLVETVARKLFAGVPAAKFAIDSLVPTTPAVGMNVSDVLPPPSTVPTTKAWLDHGDGVVSMVTTSGPDDAPG